MGTALFDRTTRPVQPLAHVKDQESEMRALALRLRVLKNRWLIHQRPLRTVSRLPANIRLPPPSLPVSFGTDP